MSSEWIKLHILDNPWIEVIRSKYEQKDRQRVLVPRRIIIGEHFEIEEN